MRALEESDLPQDEPFLRAVREHVEFGTQVATSPTPSPCKSPCSSGLLSAPRRR